MNEYENDELISTLGLSFVILGRYVLDYKEDWNLIMLDKPYTIVRCIDDEHFESLDGEKKYGSRYSGVFDINDTYVMNATHFLRIVNEYELSYEDLDSIRKLVETFDRCSTAEDMKLIIKNSGIIYKR